MSLPTPTGNPYPYHPGHSLYSLPKNLAWIERERIGTETDLQVVNRLIDQEIKRYSDSLENRPRHKDGPLCEPGFPHSNWLDNE